jgi:hypothetical protein
MAGLPGLEHFLLRARALGLYRQYLRASKLARDSSTRATLVDEIRRQFTRYRDVKDPQTVKYLVSDGATKLKELTGMLQMQA